MKRLLILLQIIFIFCALALFCGCGGERVDTAEQSMKLSRADMKYKNIYIADFTVSPQGVKESKPEPLLAEAQSKCVSELSKSGLFENVNQGAKANATPSSLFVHGELTKLRIVGGAARFWVGGMAGRSEMTVHIRLVDSSTGALVGEKDIREDTNPTAGAWSMGASDKALNKIVGGLIADYVVSSARK